MTFDPTSVEVTCVTVPKDHCVQVPWEYVNVCGYSYQFCKNYHIHTYTYILRTYYVHTTYILHTTYRISDHIVSFWTTFRRDKKPDKSRDQNMQLSKLWRTVSLQQRFRLYCRVCVCGGGGWWVEVFVWCACEFSISHFNDTTIWNHGSISTVHLKGFVAQLAVA